jgi:hypothetical protein
MSQALQQRIMQYGAGWYWEVITAEHDIIARGLADTHAQARADSQKVQPPDPAHMGKSSALTADGVRSASLTSGLL